MFGTLDRDGIVNKTVYCDAHLAIRLKSLVVLRKDEYALPSNEACDIHDCGRASTKNLETVNG